jgi:hypothetical protein
MTRDDAHCAASATTIKKMLSARVAEKNDQLQKVSDRA